MKDEMIESLQR